LRHASVTVRSAAGGPAICAPAQMQGEPSMIPGSMDRRLDLMAGARK
jgi:hypothetical protein